MIPTVTRPCSANAPPSGKVFDRWLGENGLCANRFSANTTYTMPNANATITASYKDAPALYTLTVDYGTGDGSYAVGEVINIVANAPAPGKVFNRWRDDDEYCANRYDAATTYTMPTGNKRVYAYYTDAPAATTTTTTTRPSAFSQPGQTEGAGQYNYSIISVGTVNGVTRTVTLEGIRRKTWADFALWMSVNNAIYFKSGEVFNGKVHSNEKLWFSGNPIFYAEVTSGANDFGGSTNACVFHEGFRRGVATDTMASVNFNTLRSKSSMIVTGLTTVVMAQTNLLVTNSRRGWNQQVITMTNDAMVLYVASAGSGADPDGDAMVAGTLDGRLTVATDRDILITNHLEYAVDAKTNSAGCNDALGLIAKGDIVVKPTCPDNVKIFAHMIATGQAASRNGSFGVENYNSGSPRGNLNVHGGIVQDTRGAVGTFNTGTGNLVTGFNKMYTYDIRFVEDPPPEYPTLSDKLEFGSWRDR